MNKRIVITGMSIMTPIGDNLNDYYNNLISGKSAITKISSFDTSKIACKIGGDMGDYDIKKKLDSIKNRMPEEIFKKAKKIIKTAPFATKLTILNAMEVFIDSGLLNFDFDRDRMCGILGGNNLNQKFIIDTVHQFDEEPEYIPPLTGIVLFDTDVIASISEIFGFYGPIQMVGGACAGAGIAMKNAVNLIYLDECDIALVGGGILDYSDIGLHAMSMINALGFYGYNDKPEKASRPFDKDRNGFIFSHGTGMLILEELEHAKKRGAKIYGEILAVDSNSDANHLSNPSPIGQTKLINKVLKKANIKPEQIDYINCHATSTILGDISEIETIKNVFGQHSYKLKINAPKSMLGHTGWSAFVVELIGGILQMNNSKLHPSINVDNLDPEIDKNIDICANKSQDYEINYLLKNSFGIGGFNCSAVIKKYIEK